MTTEATLAAARTMLDATGAALAEATKRITALEAERDAAIARADDTEQRATAAIVAWINADAKLCDCFAHHENECACGAWDDCKRVYETDIANAIERGDHLMEPKP